MRKTLAVLLLLALVTVPAMAQDVVIKAQPIEVQGLVGTLGTAIGGFWPVVDLLEYDIQLGPMVAVGDNTAVVGGGLKIGITIDAPILKNLNFGWLGYGRNWEENTWGLEYGLGIVMAIP